jgi:hypothetical protein
VAKHDHRRDRRDRQDPPRYRDPEPEPWRRAYGDEELGSNEAERSPGRRAPEEWPAEPATNLPLSYGTAPVDVEAEPMDDPW